MATDWGRWGHHEIELGEIQAITKATPKHWGWLDNAQIGGMYLGGNDDFIALRFHVGKDFEPVTRALWRKLCEGAQIAIDVGSHSGVFTLDAYRAGAKTVISIDPHPINYARLVLNLRHSGYGCQGAVFGAVGEKNGVEMLSVANLFYCHAAGFVGEAKGGRQSIPTRVFRLDCAIPQSDWTKVKVLKIDAENLTPAVLRGMGGMLDHCPDLIIECLDAGMDEILKARGYRFWRIWETGTIEPVDNLLPHNPNGNYNGTHEDCRNRFASVRDLP